jgi:RNA polymerase sigma-70 factor (ECF subfamily)
MPVLAGGPRRGREAGLVTSMPEETGEDDEQLLRLAAAGDGESWQALVGRSRQRLRRMVAFRLDQRLQGRVDPSDVLQDAYLEAWRDLRSYLDRPEIPFFLWLRGIAGNKLRELHRHHLGTRMRDPRREVAIRGGATAESTTTAMAAELLGDLTRASEQAVRLELKLRLREALNAMDPLDREVLALRHFEHLSPAEAARVLGIKEKAAGMRYVRALRRLKGILDGLGGGWLEP